MDEDFTPIADRGPIRVGDADRDRAAAALGEHYSAGRLDRAELDTRLAAALAARTEADLAALFVDLPSKPMPVDSTQSQHPAAAGPWPGPRAPFPRAIIAAALVLAVAAAVHGFPPFFLIPLFWWIRMGRRGRYRTPAFADPAHRGLDPGRNGNRS